MRPFPNRDLNPVKENFNKRLSATGKCTEYAFGFLRGKWRIFGKVIEVILQRVVSIIKCACILHKVFRERDGDSDLDYCQEVTRHFQGNDQTPSRTSQRAEHGGARKGSAQAKYIREQFANEEFHN
jgi:hypothetical protein